METYENENDRMAEAPEPQPAAQTDEQRPEPDQKTKNYIGEWVTRIKNAKDFYDPTFKRMRECQHIVKFGGSQEWTGKKDDSGRYVVPVIKRHINQSVAQLYAKNPKSYAERKQRRMGSVWDGKLSTLQEAAQQVQVARQSGLPPDPTYIAVLEDAAAVQKYVKMMDGLADTLNILHEYYVNEQSAGYKQQFKALVRRVKINGVAYVTLGFQRLLQKRQDVEGKIQDATDQIAAIEQRMKEAARDDVDEDSAKLEELQRMLCELQEQEYLIVREGPVFGFPKSTKIIVDPAVTHLKTLTGADWWAEEFDLTPEDIEAQYKVDVRGHFKAYQPEPDARPKWSAAKGKAVNDPCAKVWKVQQKSTGLEFVICEGYYDYLKAPCCPDVKIERFFTLFPLVFNEVEDEDDQIPPSDVWDARHSQDEYNRARQGLAEHRRQNKPGYYSPTGALSPDDKKKLATRQSGDIVEVGALVDGQDLKGKLAAIPTILIDPTLYDVEPLYNDMLRVVGSQAANQGVTKGDTATESSIAENSRQVSESSHVDDLDDLLGELSRATGQLMLLELSKETVVEIVGPGAVWPDMPQSREEIAKDLVLSIKAGSSGRPNRAAKLANMERGMPVILQLPGVNPVPIAEEYLDLLEIDAENKVVEGMPSIIAMNAMMTRQAAAASAQQTGDGNAPGAQGAKGADNAPKPAENEPQSQPAFPASTAVPGGPPT
jgi:hypothetical protein